MELGNDRNNGASEMVTEMNITLSDKGSTQPYPEPTNTNNEKNLFKRSVISYIHYKLLFLN